MKAIKKSDTGGLRDKKKIEYANIESYQKVGFERIERSKSRMWKKLKNQKVIFTLARG